MRKIICKQPGCFRTIDPASGHTYCIEHQAQERAELERRRVMYKDARHGMWSEMYSSPKWKAARDLKLKEQPFCEICGAEATEVHHRTPHNGNWGLFLDTDNLMSICKSCHIKETQKESERRKQDNVRDKRKLWY